MLLSPLQPLRKECMVNQRTCLTICFDCIITGNPIEKRIGKLISVHIGTRNDMSKQPRPSITAELDGFSGDNHKGFSRVAYDHDSDPIGTVRRNNRQWSGVSLEELNETSPGLCLGEILT